ncbi:MAG: helix-turn-helix domain-containing protein, partial [Faecalibacillus sp.]
WIEGDEIETYQGECCLINTQRIHKSQMSKGTDKYMGFAVQINYPFIKSVFPDIDNYYFQQPHDNTEKEIIKIIYNIINEYDSSKEYKNIKILSEIYHLIYCMIDHLLIRNNQHNILRNSKDNKKIMDMINYIDKNYMEQLSIETIASHFHLSVGYLLKYFKNHMGMTVKEYINNVRVINAKNDLVFTKLTITDISYIHGFPNLKSFTQLFRRKYGMNPNEYRKKMKK